MIKQLNTAKKSESLTMALKQLTVHAVITVLVSFAKAIGCTKAVKMRHVSRRIMMHIDIGCKRNCWNPFESYGEICVGCGCCSKDKKVRYKARLDLAKRMLKEQLDFNRWAKDERIKELQEANCRSNIRYWKRAIKRYERLLKEVEE